jgi:hypothetical protein
MENVIDTGFSTSQHQKQSNTIISGRGDGQEDARDVFVIRRSE